MTSIKVVTKGVSHPHTLKESVRFEDEDGKVLDLGVFKYQIEGSVNELPKLALWSHFPNSCDSFTPENVEGHIICPVCRQEMELLETEYEVNEITDFCDTYRRYVRVTKKKEN